LAQTCGKQKNTSFKNQPKVRRFEAFYNFEERRMLLATITIGCVCLVGLATGSFIKQLYKTGSFIK
jgi:hypothetical protein